ncbi:MAG: hypothetical protein AAB890_00880 [Patescibacteria group bacterium]
MKQNRSAGFTILVFMVTLIFGFILGALFEERRALLEQRKVAQNSSSFNYYTGRKKIDLVDDYRWEFDGSNGLVLNVRLNKKTLDLPNLPKSMTMHIPAFGNDIDPNPWRVEDFEMLLIEYNPVTTDEPFASMLDKSEYDYPDQIVFFRHLGPNDDYLFKIFLHKKESSLEDVTKLRKYLAENPPFVIISFD